MTNPIDERQRRSSAELQAAAEKAGIDPWIQLIGAINGQTEAARDQHAITLQMLMVLNESILATRGLTDELAALREQRAKGGNGHAAGDDTLEGG